MNKKRFEEIQIGEPLCDMHDGLHPEEGIAEPVEVLSCHQLQMVGGSDFIKKSLKIPHYVNKHLVLASLADYRDGKWYAYAVYSYDDSLFGTVKLRIAAENPSSADTAKLVREGCDCR